MNELRSEKDLIHLRVNAHNVEELLKELCSNVLEKKFIEPIFVENVIEREKTFPTGLPTDIPLAIPHVHEGCIKSFFSMAICENPIEFESMDGSDEKIPVKLVFLFGITNPSQQTKILMKFCEIFQNNEILTSMLNVNNEKELVDILKNILKGYVIFKS